MGINLSDTELKELVCQNSPQHTADETLAQITPLLTGCSSLWPISAKITP